MFAVNQNTKNQLYIGNLDTHVTTEMIYNQFYKYNIVNINHPYNHTKQCLKQFAFLTFKTPTDAKNARQGEQNTYIGKKPIRLVNVIPKNTIGNDFNDFKARNAKSNVFVKNLDKDWTYKEFDDWSMQFGNVITNLMKVDDKGSALGYGYIQYSEESEAQKCVADSAESNKDKEEADYVNSAEIFQSRGTGNRNSVQTKCNLYVKNLVLGENQDLKALEAQVTNTFSNFGEVKSSFFTMDQKTNKPFGFVCFDTIENAQTAIDNLNDKDTYNTGEKLYVGYAQAKKERRRILASTEDQSKESQIYLRDLKLEATQEQLKEAFAKFGDIKSLSVKQTMVQNEEKKFGIINFSKPEEAKLAIAQGPQQPDVQGLFSNSQQVYIKPAQTKAMREKFKGMKKREYMMKKQQNQMFGGSSRRMMPNMQMFMSSMAPFFAMMQGSPMFQNMMSNGGRRNMGGNHHNGQRRNNYNNRNNQQGGNRGGNRGHYQRRYNNRSNYQGNNQNQGQQFRNNGTGAQGANRGQQQMNPQQQQFMRQQQMDQQRMAQHQQAQRAQQQLAAQQSSQNQPQQPQVPQQPQQAQPQQAPAQFQQPPQQVNVSQITQIKGRLDQFKVMPKDDQRNILGELLFPMIKQYCLVAENAPKVTGMLIDLSVMEVEQILDLTDHQDVLRTKVQEAEQLILATAAQRPQQ